MAGYQQQTPSRIFIMLPLLYFSGKFNLDNEIILYYLRLIFIICQLISLLIGFYIKNIIEKKKDLRKIYLPPTGLPWAQQSQAQSVKDNNEFMTPSTYYLHETSKAREFINQTLIGAIISFFIHYKFNINQIILIQTVMIPLNLYDNALVRKYILGKGEFIWGEKIDNNFSQNITSPKGNNNHIISSAISKAWDESENIHLINLYETVCKDPNIKTFSDGWTALMVVSGSNKKITDGEIKKCNKNNNILTTMDFIKAIIKKCNADITIQDNDGWNAFHWAVFHKNIDNLKTLLDISKPNEIEICLKSEDSQGRTPLKLSEDENNIEITKIIKDYLTGKYNKSEETKISSEESDKSNLRQRKPVRDTEQDTKIHDVD